MPRDINTITQTELSKGLVLPALFFRGDFLVINIRVWNGYNDFVLLGETYTANGVFLGVSNIQEVGAIVSSGFSVSLSGIDDSVISTILQAGNKKLLGKVYLCFLDLADHSIVGEPIILCSGFLSESKIENNPEGVNVNLQYENESIFFKDDSKHKYTHEGQRAFYSNDDGFEYVSYMKTWRGKWGVI